MFNCYVIAARSQKCNHFTRRTACSVKEWRSHVNTSIVRIEAGFAQNAPKYVLVSYVIMLQWIYELRCRFTSGEYKVPAESMVVSGLGKHNSVRGQLWEKALVWEIMHRRKSSLRVDQNNMGWFIAKGRCVKRLVVPRMTGWLALGISG